MTADPRRRSIPADDDPPTRFLSRHLAFQPIAALVAWVYLYLVGLLGLWIVLVMGIAGWDPVVITSGSMSPTLRPGDVLMVDAHPDALVGQRAVITFESPRGDGELITHRVFEVLADDRVYITKGDANPSPDSDRVAADAVVGLGRLVIPLIGLPVVWAERGQAAPLVAMVVLTIAALVTAAAGTRTARRQQSDDRSTTVADRAIRRVRVLVGLMIASQFFLDGDRIDIVAVGLSGLQLAVLAIAALGATNWMSARAERRYTTQIPSRIPLIELVCDTLLMVFLTTATGGAGIGWVLIALPIVEAAVRFRLAGALVQWMLMAAITFSARLWVLERDGATVATVIDELDRLLDQLGVLLLVVIPGAYLAEQLVSDVVLQRRSAAAAVERGRLLEQVAEVGNEINRLGPDMFATLTRGVVALGFDQADAIAHLPDGSWRTLATAGAADRDPLPSPGDAGSGLRDEDLDVSEVVVDGNDPDLAEFMPLADRGLQRLVRVDVISKDQTRVSVRATQSDASSMRAGNVQALRLLCAQATVALNNNELMSELRAIHDELEHQAHHDVLTGLPNRAHFVAALRRGRQSATDPNRRHALLFMDLDGFKAVNDKLGHDAGDALLHVVGDRIKAAVGPGGLVARLGGDEFTVLLQPVADPSEASEVASRIHAALSDPIIIGIEKALIGVSIGIAFEEIGLNDSELLRRADAAMYAAKATDDGRRVAIYDRSMDEATRRRGRLANEFRKALVRDELQLLYQPMVDSRDDTIRGVEALLRWTHPELGPINTATILELAEVSKSFDELNAWILNTALGDLASWALADDVDFDLAVNVSPEELDSTALIENISDALVSSGIPSRRLTIELSERIVTSHGGHIENLPALIALGVGLSLDDFGEGRTSLAYLRYLPIQQLKLDRILVQQACLADADQLILSSVVTLAHDLGFSVVAEGIETAEHRAAVTNAGADLLQGFGIHRPMPADDVRRLLERDGLVATVIEHTPAGRVDPRTSGGMR